MLERQFLVNGMLIAGWGFCMLGAALLTFHAGRRAQPPLYSNPPSIGHGFAQSPSLVVFFFFTTSPALGMTNTILAMYLAGYATGHLRLPDLRKLARKALNIVITTGLSSFFMPWYSSCWKPLSMAGKLKTWSSPALSWQRRSCWCSIVAGIYPKNRRPPDPRLRPDAPKVLRRYSQSITNILDLHRLAEVVLELSPMPMEISGGYLVMVDYEKDPAGNYIYQLRGVSGRGRTATLSCWTCQKTDPLALYFCQDHRPLTQAELQMQTRFRGVAAPCYAWVANLGADVYIGIYTKWNGSACWRLSLRSPALPSRTKTWSCWRCWLTRPQWLWKCAPGGGLDAPERRA